MAFTYRSKSLAPWAGSPFQAKAILEPSGEKAGEVSCPGNAVNGTAVKAACSCGRCCRKMRNTIAMPATTMSNKTDASIQRRDQFERCTKGAPLESSGAAVSTDDGLAPS